MAKLQTLTAMMGPFYGLLQSCQGWLVDQGVDAAVAAKFTGAVFQGMAGDAAEASAVGGEAGAKAFEELIAEQVSYIWSQIVTPGDK